MPLVVRIGMHPEAQTVGGLNLFGGEFGNHPLDLLLRLESDLDDASGGLRAGPSADPEGTMQER